MGIGFLPKRGKKVHITNVQLPEWSKMCIYIRELPSPFSGPAGMSLALV
jgi:hypothetical protein